MKQELTESWIQSAVLEIKLELLTFIQSVTRLALRMNYNSNMFKLVNYLAKNLSHFTFLKHLDFQAAVSDLSPSGLRCFSQAFPKKL